MKILLGFISNLLLSIIFGWDIMNYYFLEGMNIINNNVNRPFIMWFGFITSFVSSNWFLQKHFKNQYEKNKLR